MLTTFTQPGNSSAESPKAPTTTRTGKQLGTSLKQSIVSLKSLLRRGFWLDPLPPWEPSRKKPEPIGPQWNDQRRLPAASKAPSEEPKPAIQDFNIDNTLRQRVASLLDEVDKGRIKGFSAEEIKAMNEFAAGTPTRNSVRLVANILGGGGGMATLLAGGIAGAAGGYPAAVALPAAGIGAKMTQNALGRRAMTKLDETVRSRSPLYQERLAAAPVAPLPRTAPAIGMRMTMATGQSGLPSAYLSGDEELGRFPLIRR